jgi:hypothetical protein
LDDAKSESMEEDESKEEEPHNPVLRRSMRERMQPKRYTPPDFHANFDLYIIDYDPITVREAVNSKDSKIWKKVMVEEMDDLDKNEAWDLVDFPTRRKATGSKWVFKKKLNAIGKVEKYKARLVEKGYSHVEGIDLSEKISLVVKSIYVRFIYLLLLIFILK